MKEQQIIDEGIIHAENGLKYKYRCFLDMPIGMGILYPEDKTPDILMQEMQVESEKQESVIWQNTGQILPVHKCEDGTIEMPLVLMHIYMACFNKQFEMVYVNEEFETNHEQLYSIWEKGWIAHKAKSVST